jgi:hypothetical protein
LIPLILEVAVKTNPPRRPWAGRQLRNLLLATGAAAVLGACGYRPLSPYDTQQDLTEAIRMPAGHQAVLEAKSSGNLFYECQAIKRTPYEYGWLLRRPGVELTDSYGNSIVLSPGPRPSWGHKDGSRVSVRDVVEAPNGRGNLPLQRARVDASAVPGALQNISYVQRLRTRGGLAPQQHCGAAQLGMRVTVPYEADYVFWRPLQ